MQDITSKKWHQENYSLVNSTTKNLATQQQRVEWEGDQAGPKKESALVEMVLRS